MQDNSVSTFLLYTLYNINVIYVLKHKSDEAATIFNMSMWEILLT